VRRAVIGLLIALVPAAVPAAERSLRETRRYPAPPGTRLLVDAPDMDVTLRLGDVEAIAVTTDLAIAGVSESQARAWIEGHTPQVDAADGLVAVRVPKGHYGFLGLGLITRRARLELVVPPGVVPEIHTTGGSIRVRGDFPGADPLVLRSAQGDVSVLGAARSVDVATTSGAIRIEAVRPLDRLTARTTSGDVELVGGARTVEVDTASGDVRLAHLSGSVQATSSTGDVVLAFDRLPDEASVRASSSSGTVRLLLPEGTSPRGTLTTQRGSIRCALPGTVSGDGHTVTLEGSGPELALRTGRGELRVGTGTAGWTLRP